MASCDKISIKAILRSSLNGKQVLVYYDQNKSLNLAHRKLLSGCIVQHLIEYNVNPSPSYFLKVAELIEELFTTENKDIYCFLIKGRKPGGYLYSKYHNSISNLRKEGILEPSSRKKSTKTELVVDTVEPEENLISAKDWLKFNIEPLDTVLKKWEETYTLRKSFIKEHTLIEIFAEWPLLKQSFGYKLITSDFCALYPQKINCIFEKWEGFSISIVALLQKSVKGQENFELLKQLKESQNNDFKNNIILHLIHCILKPTGRKCIIDRSTRKRTFKKASIEDSRNALIQWAPTSMELKTKLKINNDEIYANKDTLQPLICGIGKTLFEINEFYVFYGNVLYKLPNIVSCVDVLFKIFFVLDLKYPEDCTNIWLFVQEYFYEIKVENNQKNTVLSTILNDIKN